MKRVRVLPDPTPGLAEYLDSVDNPSWDEFGAHNAGESLRELRATLARSQHHICAYCEIDIWKSRRQVEHVIPRSDEGAGERMALDVSNMAACCMGGTVRVVGSGAGDDGDYYRAPIRHNMSCGQAKNNRYDDAFIDPREIPAVPSLMSVHGDGLIEADERACQAAGLSAHAVTRTIDMLNLNAERLRVARSKWRNALLEESRHVENEGSMSAWIRSLLTPNADGQLLRFFTTSRCFFGPMAERILDERPQAWI